MDDKLDRLWVEYRGAFGEPDAGPDFMPKMWQRIDARRNESLSVFKRLAQVCVAATIAIALILAVAMPQQQQISQEQGVNGAYIDVVAAEQSTAAEMAVDNSL